MEHRSRLGEVLAIAAATVLLAGCAAPSPAPTHSPPSTTPTPTTASAPGSRVPVGCADLLGSTTVLALAGVNAKILQDENSAPSNMQSIAQQQYGAEDCVWDGEYTGVGTSTGAYLSVSIAPDAKAAFESQFSELMATTTGPSHPAATENVAGDQSGYWCATDPDILGADQPSLTCDAEMLVGDYWVGINLGNVSGRTGTQLMEGLATALKHIASALNTAGAPKTILWRSPETIPPAFCSDSASTATVRAIMGAPSLAVYPAGKWSVSASRIGLDGRHAVCYWTSPTAGSVDVELLAGGSWAIPGFKPVLGDSVVQSVSPVTVPGAASALLGCDSGSCSAFLAVGPTAVELDFDDLGASKDIPALTAFAKAIAAS